MTVLAELLSTRPTNCAKTLLYQMTLHRGDCDYLYQKQYSEKTLKI